jgi:hypothetical protein
MAQLHLSREEIVKLVSDIVAGDGTEEQRDEWSERLAKAVDHPAPNKVLIFDRKYWNMGPEKFELMADELLNYKPICL